MNRVLNILIISILLSSSCKMHRPKSRKEINADSLTQKTSKTSEIEKSDSSYEKPPVNYGVQLSNPCDSNGKLKQLSLQLGNSKAGLRVKTIHDTIYIDCDCEGSISRFRSEKVKSDSSFVELQKRFSEKEQAFEEKNGSANAQMKLWRLRFWGLLIFIILVLFYQIRARIIKFLKGV
jgi:hypothetical protein